MTLTPAQSLALSHIKNAYLGPEQGEKEVLFNRPSLQYAVGMLFPVEDTTTALRSATAQESDPEIFLSADVAEGDVEEEDSSAPLAEDWRPSSAAISFVTDKDSLECDFAAATYVPVLDDGPSPDFSWNADGPPNP